MVALSVNETIGGEGKKLADIFVNSSNSIMVFTFYITS